MAFRVRFFDHNPELIHLLRETTAQERYAEIGDVWEFADEMPEEEAVHSNTYISPANSFGYMNGGIDADYCVKWPGIAGRVRAAISQKPFQELLVGEALDVRCNKNTFLIVAPTMRVAMPITGENPVNAYLATRAALRAWSLKYFGAGDDKQLILNIPGMGTGWGQMPPWRAAHQMVLGVYHGLFGFKTPMPHAAIAGQQEMANV